MMKTRITELLGIEYPIICAGMTSVTSPELVAAVSNAGGLGIMNITLQRPEEVRPVIDEIRRLTDKPFGVHVTQLLPGAEENLGIAIEERVPVVNTAFGKCDWYRDAVHSYGGKVIVTTSTLRHALAAQLQGADAVIATSYEAAAHSGAIGAMALIPAVRDALDIPLIAAGGIADGRGLVAALALGADAVSMGTRFMATEESAVHENSKQAVIKSTVEDSVLSENYDGIPVRVIATPFARRMAQRKPWFPIMWGRAWQMARHSNLPIKPMLKDFPGNFSLLRFLAWIGHGMFYMMRGIEQGDQEAGLQPVGQSQGLIHRPMKASDIVQDIVREAASVKEKLA